MNTQETINMNTQETSQDYTVQLRAKYKLWVAEILSKGEGAYKFDRRFLDKEECQYLSEYGNSIKQVEFFCKNGIIYQSFYSTGRMTGEYRFHFNNTEYETYEQALAAKLAAEEPAAKAPIKKTITHSEFMKLAWTRAKELAGGSKGSKKFLSQAMREINRSKTSMLITESQYKQLFSLLAEVKKMENDETFGKVSKHWTDSFENELKIAISNGTLYNNDGYIETKTYPSFGKGLFIKEPHTETVVLVKELSDVRKNFENKSGLAAIAWKKHPTSIEAAIELTTLTKILLLA